MSGVGQRGKDGCEDGKCGFYPPLLVPFLKQCSDWLEKTQTQPACQGRLIRLDILLCLTIFAALQCAKIEGTLQRELEAQRELTSLGHRDQVQPFAAQIARSQ